MPLLVGARRAALFNRQPTPTPDTTPDPFTFVDITGAATSTVYVSAPITVSGIDAAAAISVAGGEYSINGGSFVTTPGTVVSGDQVRVRVTSGSGAGVQVNTTVTIGGVADTYSVTTAVPSDSTPDAFTFTDVTGATASSVVTSAPITVAGIDTASAITITGGTYSINGGAFTSAAGTVVLGDQVRARVTASSSPLTQVDAVVTIGGVSDTFSVTTASAASAISSLQVIGATPLLDATNDYSDATSRPGIDANGWVAKVQVPYQAGQTFDPTKISLTVQDPGFDGSGATTVTRTITGRAILRRQYSAYTSRQQSNDGVTLTVYFSLSDHIYGGSTITAASAASGFYGSSASGSITSPTNSSTVAYPKPLFAWLNLQHERATGTSFNVEAVAYSWQARNGRQVARVEFIAADASSHTAATQTATTPSLSAFQTQGQIVECYKATIPLSALTQADLCQVNAKVYPWIGDSSAVLDLSVDGVAWPTAQTQTKLRFLNDKAGTYGGAIAYVKAGASGGTVSLTDATARAAPFPTINGALSALKTFNNGRSPSHNDHSGGTIYLMDDGAGGAVAHTPTADMDTITAGLCWTDIKVDPSAVGAVSWKTHATNQQTLPSLIRISCPIDQYRNLRSGTSPASIMFALEGATITTTNALSGVPLNYQFGLTYQRNTTFAGTMNDIYSCFSLFSTARIQTALALGVVCENASTDIKIAGAHALIGCKLKRHFIDEQQTSAAGGTLDPFDGQVFANNLLRDVRTASQLAGAQAKTRGIAIVQNVLERAVGASSNPGLFLAGDGYTTAVDNIVFQHNTFPGADAGCRLNITYVDEAASVSVIKKADAKFNLIGQWNCKTDVYTTKTSATGRCGNWRTRYTVGHRGNVVLQGDASGNTSPSADGVGNFLGEAWPASTYAVGVGAVTFTDDKSATAGAGSGTYSLTGGSNAAYNQVPAGLSVLAYDIAGVARRTDGTGASGAYERTV